MTPSALPMQQRCVRCEQYKDLKDFQPSRRGKTGAWCRECYNVDQRKRRGKTYATDPSLPKASAVIAKCVVDECTYVGGLLRGMCRNHYMLWQKQNTNVSWFVDIQTTTGIEPGMICGGCKIGKPLTEFYTDGNAKCGYRNRCKSCCRLDQVKSRNRSPIKAQSRTLKHSYGITSDQLDQMIESQDGKCAICGRIGNVGNNRRLAIDHCHTTKRVRGLLCNPCNMILGNAQDSVELLTSAIAYLLRYTEDQQQEAPAS